jgi:predicted amidohydrolase YtcJ
MKKADMVLFNGKIHTVDSTLPAATAVAIYEGKIIAVGDDAPVFKRKGLYRA